MSLSLPVLFLCSPSPNLPLPQLRGFAPKPSPSPWEGGQPHTSPHSSLHFPPELISDAAATAITAGTVAPLSWSEELPLHLCADPTKLASLLIAGGPAALPPHQ